MVLHYEMSLSFRRCPYHLEGVPFCVEKSYPIPTRKDFHIQSPRNHEEKAHHSKAAVLNFTQAHVVPLLKVTFEKTRGPNPTNNT